MALIEKRFTAVGNELGVTTYDKVAAAIERIRFAAQVSLNQGKGALYVAFSGGKDSLCLAELCRMAGVDFELHYNVTTVDPPDLVRFIAKNYPYVHWDKADKSMWKLIASRKLPPLRQVRYCCQELKERGGEGRICLTGVRRAESVKRAGRRPYEIKTPKAADKVLLNDNDVDRRDWEYCAIKGKHVCNPIIDWEDSDVWDFIRGNNLPYCKLYDEGWKRIGCIGCPMASVREREFEFARYPWFKQKYIQAFDAMLANLGDKTTTWHSGEDVFNWWLYGTGGKLSAGQLTFNNREEENQ